MKELSRILTACGNAMGRMWNLYKNCFKSRPWYIKTLSAFATVIVIFLLYLGAVDLNLFWLFGKSPGWAEVSKHQTPEASELYSADGVLLGKYFNENRTPVEYEEVNPVFWQALIDTEDERFYSHWGIDPLGMLGAAKDAATGAGARGASTITQQLAKNMFRTRKDYSTGLLGNIPGIKMLILKTKEWILALKLEAYFSWTMGRKNGKNEILTQYANTVDFGHNAFGIKTASKTYFNCMPKDLTVEQAAVLVGMLKATTYYNPISHPENALTRRNVVLENMRVHGDLTAAQYVEAKNKGIDVSEFNVEDNYDGKAKYFREAIAKHIKQLCKEEILPEGLNLYTDGLKIYTTLDTKMQEYAERAAMKHMKTIQQRFDQHWRGMQPWQDENHQVIANFIEDIAKQQPAYKYLASKYNNNQDSIDYYLNKPHTVKVFDYEKGEVEKEMSTMDSIRYMVSFMHCGFVAMEPQTGYVKAWVGDIDFDHWKYDKVTSMRQPGSTFKLFVYTEAMEQGLTPCDRRRDEYFQMEVWDKKEKKNVIWRPTNSDGRFSGDSMPLRAAFARSVNSVAVRLGQQMGIKNIANTAHEMGIKSKLDEEPSLALGSSDVNLLELANAYSCIANYGQAHEQAILITKIVDRNGETIYEAPTETKKAVKEETAFYMQQMLHAGIIEAGGTSQPLWTWVGKYTDTDFGGKTGTSNNHSDAWFVATSPNLVCATWVGGEYRCIHFRTGALGQGSRAALPLCGYFLEYLLADNNFKKYHGKYKTPAGISNRAAYECYYSSSLRNDSINGDSLGIAGEDATDENGNPIQTEGTSTPQSATEPTETGGNAENL